MPSVAEFVADYVAVFNAAVTSGDYSPLLARYADNAVLRFENVPPEAGSLEFAGRNAIADAYAQNPPDDQIDITGEPVDRGDHVTVGFAWRRDHSPGVLDFVAAEGLISALTVIFG
jgi:ketosteroid isomerase-like protein